MITEFDIYVAFRRAQSDAKNRPFVLPKDWESHNKKMHKKTQDAIYHLAGCFNTTHRNLDLDEYMACGFELYKNFSYAQFTNPKVLNHYIQKDKIKKRNMSVSTEQIENTFRYLNFVLRGKQFREGYTKLQGYCRMREGEIRSIVEAYNKGKVDSLTFVYCIWARYISLSDDERALVPYINQRYRELVENMQSMLQFIRENERNME